MMQAATSETVDVRSTDLRETMADHWSDHADTYYQADQCTVLHDGPRRAVVDDHGGFQFRLFVEGSAHTERRFRELMYDLAHDTVGGPLHTDNVLVFDKAWPRTVLPAAV